MILTLGQPLADLQRQYPTQRVGDQGSGLSAGSVNIS
jgi:hypothetical protein